MVLPRSGSQLHREFLRAAYLAHFYFLFLLMICQVFYRKVLNLLSTMTTPESSVPSRLYQIVNDKNKL